MKVFFTGWGTQGGFSMMLGWIGVRGHCRRIWNSQLSPDLFHHPMWNQSLRNAGCRHIAWAVFCHALHCRACQVSLPIAVPCVKMEPENIKMKLIPMVSVLCYIFTARWMQYVTQTVLCWLQHIGQILIYYQSNIRHLIKHWRWTNSSSSYDITYIYTMWKLLYNVHNIHGSYKILCDISWAHKIMVYKQRNTILS